MKKTIFSILCLLTLSTNAFSDTSVQVLQRGTGPKTNNKDELLINYQLWLFDAGKPENKGKLVEKNLKPDQPTHLFLDKNKMIHGLYESLVDQFSGSRLEVTVPPEMAYGAKKEGEIPANSTLIYQVEILAIVPTKL